MGMSLRHKENITNIRKVYFGCIMRSEKLERVTTEKICGKKDRGRQHEKSLLTIMDMIAMLMEMTGLLRFASKAFSKLNTMSQTHACRMYRADCCIYTFWPNTSDFSKVSTATHTHFSLAGSACCKFL